MAPAKRKPLRSSTVRKSTPARQSSAGQQSMARRPGGTSRGGASKAGLAKPRRASTRAKSGPPARFQSWNRLSLDRKLDIVGVFLALVGLLTLLSLFSSEHAALTGWWVVLVNRVAGWGSFILPVTLILIGVWLVLRNVERLPMLSTERMLGVILLYANVLAWMHLLAGGGFELAQAGDGGGFIGAFFEVLTVGALGAAGAYVAFTAWFIVAVALTLDVPVSDIFNFIQLSLASLVRRFKTRLARENALPQGSHPALEAKYMPSQNQAGAGLPDPAQPNGGGRFIPELDANGLPRISSELPPDFRPLDTGPQAGAETTVADRHVRSRMGAAADPARANAGAAGASTAGPANRSRAAKAAGANPVQQAAPLPPWKLPPIAEILEPAALEIAANNQDEERGELIEETLKSFGAPVKVVGDQPRPHRHPVWGRAAVIIENRAAGAETTRVRVSQDCGPGRRPGPGAGRPAHPHPGARARAQLRGHRSAQPGSQPGGPARGDGERTPSRRSKSPMRFALGKDVAGHAKCLRPGRHAAPAHRRHHRLGQVGAGQRHPDLPAAQQHPHRPAHDPGRPQARGADRLQRHPAPAGAGGGGSGAGGRRAAVGAARDGRALPPLLAGRARATSPTTTPATARRCPTCWC